MERERQREGVTRRQQEEEQEEQQQQAWSRRRNTNNDTSNVNVMIGNSMPWATVDGPLGANGFEEQCVKQARYFFYAGFFMLPWLWFVNAFYFWPVLAHRSSYPRIRPYVVGSAIGFLVYTMILFSWAFTFSFGGERLFGPLWKKLAVYNIADSVDLLGLS